MPLTETSRKERWILVIVPVCVRSPGMHVTSDLRKRIPVGEGNVPDRATKYTLRGLPRLLWAGEMRPLLGPKANDMAADLLGKEGRGGTVDTIHLFVYLEGAEGRLELVALVSMKSEVLMGQ
ncbi:hypothetical protein JOQ06_003037, partial [Pogonophryne albipinna]